MTGAEWPGGYCSRRGCVWPGFECAADGVCDRHEPGGQCLRGCSVGAEPEADRFGAAGHGAGCAAGLSCSWDGVSAAGASPNGGCVPGNYSPVVVTNIGQACLSDADCYSPFGYGRCVFADRTELTSGMCAVFGCSTTPDGILPGVATGTHVCDGGAGETCLNVGSDPVPAMCGLACTSAAECAPGYACIELTSGGLHACWAYCQSSSECRTGATCQDAARGPCDPAVEECFCSDRVPRT